MSLGMVSLRLDSTRLRRQLLLIRGRSCQRVIIVDFVSLQNHSVRPASLRILMDDPRLTCTFGKLET